MEDPPGNGSQNASSASLSHHLYQTKKMDPNDIIGDDEDNVMNSFPEIGGVKNESSFPSCSNDPLQVHTNPSPYSADVPSLIPISLNSPHVVEKMPNFKNDPPVVREVDTLLAHLESDNPPASTTSVSSASRLISEDSKPLRQNPNSNPDSPEGVKPRPNRPSMLWGEKGQDPFDLFQPSHPSSSLQVAPSSSVRSQLDMPQVLSDENDTLTGPPHPTFSSHQKISHEEMPCENTYEKGDMKIERSYLVSLEENIAAKLEATQRSVQSLENKVDRLLRLFEESGGALVVPRDLQTNATKGSLNDKRTTGSRKSSEDNPPRFMRPEGSNFQALDARRKEEFQKRQNDERRREEEKRRRDEDEKRLQEQLRLAEEQRHKREQLDNRRKQYLSSLMGPSSSAREEKSNPTANKTNTGGGRTLFGGVQGDSLFDD